MTFPLTSVVAVLVTAQAVMAVDGPRGPARWLSHEREVLVGKTGPAAVAHDPLSRLIAHCRRRPVGVQPILALLPLADAAFRSMGIATRVTFRPTSPLGGWRFRFEPLASSDLGAEVRATSRSRACRTRRRCRVDRLVSGGFGTHAAVVGAWRTGLGAAIVAATLAAGRVAAAPAVVPATLHDVRGAVVDVAALASRERLVFVTVKATWCPICRVQLQRLGRLLPHLRACGVTFVVLVPGAGDAVAAIARETSFPYPFVAENADAIAAAAGFAAPDGELVPGFFAVDAARTVVWQQRGRGAGAFGDGELMAHLGCKAPTTPDLLAFAG